MRHLLSAILIVAAAAACTFAEAPKGRQEPADAATIDQLIRQLGNTQFEERESARALLKKICCPALPPLRQAARNHLDPEVRRRATELVVTIENSLDQLLIDYRAFGLPLPPERSLFVRVVQQPAHTQRQKSGDGPWETTNFPAVYGIAFLVKPADKDQWVTLLHGTETTLRKLEDIDRVLDPSRLTIEALKADDSRLRSSTALFLALQMHARGWKIADEVFEVGFKKNDDRVPRTALRRLAWEYWDRRLLEKTTDCWPTACRQMKALLADAKELDTADNRALVKSLELAFAPTKSKPGSVEALIDDLVNARFDEFARDTDDPTQRLIDLGFDAVPALLEHLPDQRLTHYLYRPSFVSGPIGWVPPRYQSRVGDIASDVIWKISGREWSQHSGPIDVADENRRLTEWWKEAQKQGEEPYLVANVLPPRRTSEPKATDQRLFPGRLVECPNRLLVRIIGKKYPRRLPELYREILKNRPMMQLFEFAEAIADSSLTRDEKVDLLIDGAKSKNFRHVNAALWNLKKVDGERYVALLIECLDRLPPTPVDSYPECAEAYLSRHLQEAEDPRAWQALERAVRRADFGLRVQLLDNLYHPYPKPEPSQRRRLLAFFAKFLDDTTVRDVKLNPPRFEGIYAGAWIPRLEVRNFAAWEMARIVESPAQPDEKWNEEQWAKLREEMRAVCKRELDKAEK